MTTAAEFEAILESNNVEEIIIHKDKEIIDVWLSSKENPDRESKLSLNSRMRWVIEWISNN